MSRLIALQMIATYNQLTKEKQQDNEQLTKQLDEWEKKIKRLEERYINEEIYRNLFLRYKEKFITERREIEVNLQKTDNKVSNLESLIEKSITFWFQPQASVGFCWIRRETKTAKSGISGRVTL